MPAAANQWQTGLVAGAVARGTVILPPPQVSLSSQPAAGSQATITRGATTGIVHVCLCIVATWTVTTALAGGVTAIVNVRDSTTGVGTILWTFQMGLAGTAAVGSTETIVIPGLAIYGSVSQAMTVEFAASVANTQQSIAWTCIDIMTP